MFPIKTDRPTDRYICIYIGTTRWDFGAPGGEGQCWVVFQIHPSCFALSVWDCLNRDEIW